MPEIQDKPQDNPMTRAKGATSKGESPEQTQINELQSQLLRMSEMVERLQGQLQAVGTPSPSNAAVAVNATPVFANDMDARRWQRAAERRIQEAKQRKVHEQGWAAEEELFGGRCKFLCEYKPEPSMSRVVGCDYEGGMEAQGVCDIKFRKYFGIRGFAAGEGLVLTPWTGTEDQFPELQRQRRTSLKDSLAEVTA